MRRRPLEDWEDPEPDDEDEGEDDLYVCPSCGAAVYEDCEQCPQCGDYITPGSSLRSAGGSRWLVVAVVVMIALTIVAVFFSI